MNRREFLAASAAADVESQVDRCSRGSTLQKSTALAFSVPPTATCRSSQRPSPAFTPRRSEGGPHDYFSEGDYWWPDPKNPNGPYIRRDGFSNPANFNDHRELLIRLSLQMPALTAAWVITRKRPYADEGRRSSARLVRRSGHAHESEPAVCAGDSWRCTGPRHRHHRHASPRRGRPRSGVDRALRRPQTRGNGRGPPLVRRLHHVDDDIKERPRGTRRQEQPRHLLGRAGRRVRALHTR